MQSISISFIFDLCLYLLPICLASEDEFRLLRDLRQNYDPFERPVADCRDPLTVNMTVYLQQILDVDEKNQVVTIVAWVEYKWTDYKLKWIPKEYGNITDVRIPGTSGAIWRPDVILYNSADENFDSTFPVNYIVSYSGDVMQVPPGIVKLSCKIDITWFPFDDQICYLKYGSWTYSGRFIDLRINYGDRKENDTFIMSTDYFVVNGEWNLLGTPARLQRAEFGGEIYPSVFFYLVIRRRTLYYGLNLIIPSLLISLMTVLGFTLPPDAGEKITLEITILLSVVFFLSMVSDMTPPTSEAVPLIGAFFSCCMLVVSASVVFTVLVLNLHHRKPETHEMSPFMRRCLLHWLPWILMMRRPGVTLFPKRGLRSTVDDNDAEKCISVAYPSDSMQLMRSLKARESSMTAIAGSGSSICDSRETIFTDSHQHIPHHVKHHRGGGGGIMKSARSISPHVSFDTSPQHGTILYDLHRGVQKACIELRSIAGQMKVLRRRKEEEDNDEQAEADWKYAAMVVDRLCLFIFTIFIVTSTCAIMFSSPHLIA